MIQTKKIEKYIEDTSEYLIQVGQLFLTETPPEIEKNTQYY